MAKKKRQCTEKQDKFADLVASGKSKQDAILQAGYKATNSLSMGAQEIRKPWVADRVAWYCKHKYNTEPPKPAVESSSHKSLDDLKGTLYKHIDRNPAAAVKAVEIALKEMSDGKGVDIVPLLLSPFLSESELDRYRDARPQDVVVAGENKSENDAESAKEPAIIDETENNE